MLGDQFRKFNVVDIANRVKHVILPLSTRHQSNCSFHFSGYHVPTTQCPNVLLKIGAMFDKPLKMVIPWLDEEMRLDNSKVS